MNLLGTPGLGSLMAGHIAAGIGQLIIFLAGFVLFFVWTVKNITDYYHTAFSEIPPEPNGWGGRAVLGILLCVAAWIWSLMTSLNLSREASSIDATTLKSFAAGQIKADETKIQTALAALPQWRRNGEIILRTFQFKNFPAALKFVNDVGQIAEQVQHHPDIDIRWNKVTLALTTHDAGGLTEKDFAMARQCDALSLR